MTFQLKLVWGNRETLNIDRAVCSKEGQSAETLMWMSAERGATGLL